MCTFIGSQRAEEDDRSANCEPHDKPNEARPAEYAHIGSRRAEISSSQMVRAADAAYVQSCADDFTSLVPRPRRIHLFEGVHGCVFITSLAEYNLPDEDGTGNGLRESIQVFKEIVETPALRDANIVLVLNKASRGRERERERESKQYCFQSKDREQQTKRGFPQ